MQTSAQGDAVRANFFFKMDKEGEKVATDRGLNRVGWIITNDCNLQCKTCYADAEFCKGYKLGKGSGSKGNELSTEECMKVVDLMKEAGVKGVVMGGGEPMMRPDLFDIAKYAKSKGIMLSIATNGTLITDENAKEFRSIFRRAELPLDGFEETHDMMRDGTYHKITESIEMVKDKVYTSVVTLAHDENLMELPDFFERVIIPMGINEYRLMRLTMIGRSKEGVDYPEYLRNYVGVVDSLVYGFKRASEGDIVIEDAPRIYGETFWEDGRIRFEPCTPALNLLIILPDGYTTVCPILEKTGKRASHVFEKPLKEIFDYDELFVKARNRKDCGGCDFFQDVCYGGCVCAAVAGGKDISERDPSCPGP